MAIKKLIEVALPLEKINAEAAREKSIRHGHPSTLHLWWARRPLAAARAVIWASLVDDPSSHPERFPTEEEQAKERERLFKILEQLVVWENSNNEALLDIAKAEIMKSTDNNPPALLDPFAGGGAIPLEAQRLGLDTFAHDLNPVAVMINKAMIEIPPRFADHSPVNPEARENREDGWSGANGLAEDVRYYGEWLKKEAYKRIGHLYPKVKIPNSQGGGEATVIAWIWARTVQSPNPVAAGKYVPLISSLMLSKRPGKKAWIDIVEDESAPDGWRFEVHTGSISKNEEELKARGTKAGKGQDFICCLSNSPIKRDYIQEEGKAGRLSRRLMAIVAEGNNGRIYLSPDIEHEIIANSVENSPDVQNARESFLSGSTPTRAMVTGGVCSAYGLSTWGHLFTGRQITALQTIGSLVQELQQIARQDAERAGYNSDNTSFDDGGSGAKAYSEAISAYYAFLMGKLADYHSSLCSWHSSRETIGHTFTRQAIPMCWDYAEANPFSQSSGCYDNMVSWITKCLSAFPAKAFGEAKQADAQSDCGLREIMVSTDPPYYDNISYADLSDYFYVWMRQTLHSTFPNLFRTMLAPKAEELVATAYRFDGNIHAAKAFFEDGMLHAFRLLYRYARNDIPVTVYYAYKQNDTAESTDEIASSGWESMLSAIINAGFSITGTWPMRTEMANRQVATGTNALASSIVLVCRKRMDNSPTTTRRALIAELKRELRPALQKLQRSNIAPVDLAQSAIGPGMGVFSKYKKVLEADGSPMTVRSALQIINQELDIYFNEQDGELDRDSRFCVELYSQFAFNNMKFGEADTLARAKNTSVAALASTGVVYAQKGVVHLYARDELPEKVDHHEGCIWLLTQQLTRAMETGGVKACAEIIAPMFGSNSEKAKDFAYRLYTIAERKGWAQEAYAYNSLVIAWPDIQSKAAELQKIEPEQLSIF